MDCDTVICGVRGTVIDSIDSLHIALYKEIIKIEMRWSIGWQDIECSTTIDFAQSFSPNSQVPCTRSIDIRCDERSAFIFFFSHIFSPSYHYKQSVHLDLQWRWLIEWAKRTVLSEVIRRANTSVACVFSIIEILW